MTKKKKPLPKSVTCNPQYITLLSGKRINLEKFINQAMQDCTMKAIFARTAYITPDPWKKIFSKPTKKKSRKPKKCSTSS